MDRNTLFGYRQDECPEYGCLLELTIQLAVIMVGKQIINNFQEVILPRLQSWWSSRSFLKQQEKRMEELELQNAVDLGTTFEARWIQDFNAAPVAERGFFHEYLEMVLQFGFVTLFVTAFPIGPLFALLNNIVEIRVDAGKLSFSQRRPIAHRAQDIGVWRPILAAVAMLSVVTNGRSVSQAITLGQKRERKGMSKSK